MSLSQNLEVSFLLEDLEVLAEENQYQEDTFFISNNAYKIIIIIIIIINNLFTVGVINERLIAIKKLIKANYL